MYAVHGMMTCGRPTKRIPSTFHYTLLLLYNFALFRRARSGHGHLPKKMMMMMTTTITRAPSRVPRSDRVRDDGGADDLLDASVRNILFSSLNVARSLDDDHCGHYYLYFVVCSTIPSHTQLHLLTDTTTRPKLLLHSETMSPYWVCVYNEMGTRPEREIQ